MTEPKMEGEPHDPLTPEEVAQLESWLVRQPRDGKASITALGRAVATIRAMWDLPEGLAG